VQATEYVHFVFRLCYAQPMSDFDKQQWQAEEAARDAATTAYRDKMAKARERSAANAKRKIARLHAKLKALGHISEFEDEFGESVLERLETYGSAFHDLEKGRPGDALSAAQKQVVARMNRKVKDLKAKQRAGETEDDPDADYVRTADRWKENREKPRSSFRSKRKTGWTPRVRQLDEELDADIPKEPPRPQTPFRPRLVGDRVTEVVETPTLTPAPAPEPDPKPKRPFLRIVRSDDET